MKRNSYENALPNAISLAYRILFTLFVCTLFSINGFSQILNVPVTGYNTDVVANGVSLTNTATTGVLFGVSNPTIGIDGNGPTSWSLCDNTYKWWTGGTQATCGLPASNTFTSALGAPYVLQNYSGNNSMTITSGTYGGNPYNTTGSVAVTTPLSYAKLFVLYESVNNTPSGGSANLNTTVTFTDASTQVFSNTLVNWFTVTGQAYTATLQRVQNNPASNAPSACQTTGPILFEMTLNLLPANYSKQVASISFTYATAAGTAVNTVNYFHFLSLAGQAPCAFPADQPTALNLTSPSGTIINGTFTAAASTPSGYLTVAYPTGATSVAPASGTTYTIGNSLGTGKVVGVGAATSFSATGLLPGFTYDFYVYSLNSGTCVTTYNTLSPLTGSFTTSGIGATVLINPTTDGGFETGGTLASNGWSVINSGTNAWTVGTVPTGFTNQSAYISNNGGPAWAYTNNSLTASHIYKDITFPAGQTDITLSFNWKALGETSSFDAIVVYTCPTTVTPTTTSPTGTSNAATWTGGSPTAIGAQLWNQGVNLQTFTACLPASFAGTTQRIVITWKNDGSLGTSPPGAVDNISLVSSTPTAPLNQATALVLTPISTSQINGSFTAAVPAPTGYLVVRYPNLAATTNPTTGTTYTVGQALGLGTVVSVGASTTFINTGLAGGTTYDYYVYDYSTATCAGNVYNIVAPLTLSLSTLPCGAMSGVIPVGPTAPPSPAGFPTLSGAGGALAYINTNGLGGNTILELQPDYTTAYAAANETYPLTFPVNPCISNTRTLTLRPASGVPSVITLTSANSTLATVVLDGGSFITIDGRPGGAGTNKFLSIINTSSAAAAAGNAVMMRNEASNNTLTFLDLQGSNLNIASNTGTIVAGAVPGVVSILSTTGLNGNDNNTISNCDIHAATAVGNILNVGIYAYNATTVGNASNNDNNTITNCNIYDCFNAATATAGIDILVGNNNYSITNNSYYKSAALAYAYTAAVAHRGFWITPNASAVASSGFVITGNFIGGTTPGCGGSAFTTTSAVANIFNGMDISVGTFSFTSVQNNTITNFNHTTANTGSTAFVGFNIAAGNLNIGTVTGNLIGSTAINGAITFTATANTGGLIGIRTGGGTTVNISNNTVSGINLIGSATVTPVFNGINGGGGTTVNIVNNTVGSTSLANSINASSVYTGTTSIQTIRGIIVNAGTTSTVTGNTIANMNTNLTSLSGAHTMAGIAVSIGTSTVSGNTIRNLTSASQSTSGGSAPSVIGIAYTSTTAPAVISANIMHTLKNTNTTTTSGPVVAGIYYGGPSGTANLIEKNSIHSLVLSSNTVNASAAITGMDIASGQVTIRNNMIRLGYDENGNSIVVPALVRGISKNVNIANIYFNSIFIGGTGVLSTVAANTFAFQRTAAAATDDVRNNIFVNNRSNATTGGKHYQISLSSIATITLNYNDYFGTGTGTVFASNVGVDVATYTAGWVAGDANSQVGDPQFINPTGTAVTGDVHINPSIATVIEQQGTNIATVTDDFDSQTRSTLTPEDIGADAGNFSPVNACAGPPVSATAFLTVPAAVCGFATKTVSLSGFTPQPGLTYQWQESVTGLPGSFVNVTGGTGANAISYTTAPLNASIYYQCVVGCAYGAGTIESASVQALINPAPALAVTPLTGTSVCSGSNVDLSVSGANTYSWAVNPGVAGYPVVSLLTTRNNLANVTSRPTSTLASTTATPPATVATPTWTYTVTGTALNGCTATSSVVLNVITSPVVPVQLTYTNSPDPVCATGVPITFTVNNPGTIGAGSWVYNWYDQAGTTLLQSTTNTSSSDTYTPSTPLANGNYTYQVKVSNTVCPSSYAVASPAYFVGYTALNVVANANCGDNGIVNVYPEGQTNFTTWYSNTFATGLLGPAFDAAFGNTNFTGGLCNITPQANAQNGALVIRNSAFINTNNLQLDFKLSTAPRGFAFNILGADGLCWSYGSDVTVGTITTGGQGEGGSGTGLKLAFDATANGPNNLPGCYLMFNSTTVGQGPGDPGVLAYRLGSWWQGLTNAPVSIVISQNGFVTVKVNNEVIFDHVALPASYLTSNKSTWIHSFTARTGGSNELHAIDDLNIRYNSYEYSNNSTTGLDGTWQSSNTFSGLASGTYPMWVRNPSNPSCVSNVGNAVVGTSPSPSSAITVAAPGFNTVICAGSSTDLTTDVSIPGAVFLWESSANLGGPYVPAAGINNAGTYSTGLLLANAYFRCTFTCPSSSPITSTPVLVTVNSGSITSTNTPVNSNCIGDAITVTAVPGANTTCVWYAAQTGGSPLFSGNSYTVTPPSLPITYYVEPVTTLFVNHYDFGGEKSVGGNLNGGSVGGTGISSKFNTSASIRIDSIKVLPNAAGTLTVALQNAGSATNILSFNQTITAGQVGTFVNVPVNFAIAGSGNYQLTTSGVSCSYNNAYPAANYAASYMNLGGVFSIVGGSTTATGATSTSVYGTAYNWSITTSCPTGGARVPVLVQVNPATAVTVTPASSSICSGAILTLTASSLATYDSINWTPITNLFKDPFATDPYTTGYNAATVYYKSNAGLVATVTARGTNTITLCSNINTATVNVQPAAVTINSAPVAICGASGSATLSLSPASPYAPGSIQWQISSNGISYVDIPAANAVTYPTGVINVTTYYRALIRDGNNNICVTADYTLGVYQPQVLTTTPATRCGIGTLNLQATGSALTTLNWYTASTGGTSIGTGSPFTTPIIGTTTTYYVEASNSICLSGRTGVIATVTPAPAISVSSNITICESDNTTLTASSVNDPNYQYTWNPGGFVGNSYTVTPAVTTTYTVTALDMSGGINNNCQDIKTVTVTVNQRPTINSLTVTTPSGAPAICTGESAQINLTATPFIPPGGNYTVASIPFAPVPGIMPNAGPAAGDETNANVALGFNFNYFGNTYTDVTIHANGQILMGANNTTANSVFSPAVIPTAAAPNNWVGVWSDLNLSGSDVNWGIVGVAPFRQLVVNFTNVNYFSATPFITFQMVLNETFNTIDVHMVSTNGTVGNTRAIGLENATGTLGTAAPSRNGGTWAATNESWRFSPPVSSSLSFAWSPSTGLSATNISNPVATPSVNTVYTVTVSETGTGCTRTSTVSIFASDYPKVKVTPSDTTLCFGDVVTLHALDTGAYSGGYPAGTQFDWGLGYQVYDTVVVNNSNPPVTVQLPLALGGCTSTSNPITLTFNDAPLLFLEQDSVKCFGTSTGKIYTSILFGAPPYRYKYYNSMGALIANVVRNELFDTLTNVPAGDYSVVVYDNIGTVYPPPSCHSDSVSITVLEPELLVGSHNNPVILCNGNSTSVVISATGGTPPYTGTGTFNQFAGSQTYTVTDANGCSSQVILNLTEPAVLGVTLNIVNTPCTYTTQGLNSIVTGGTSAYSYSWSDGASTANRTGLAAGTFTVTVTDVNGCTTSASANTAPQGAIAISGTITNLLCRGVSTGTITIGVTGGLPPLTYLWNGGSTSQNRTALAAGTYKVTVTDASGCTKTASYVIGQPATTMLINTSKTNVRCFGLASGAATVAPSGGTSPYTYSWNTFPVKTTASITGLTAGVYSCTITDAVGCSKTAVITVTEPNDLVVFQTQTNVTFPGGADGTATVSVTGGTPGYTYSWNTVPVKTTASVTGLTAGTYKCTITDTKSCNKKVTFIITEPFAKPVEPVQSGDNWKVKEYPNPTSGIVMLSFKNETNERFRVTLTDFTGRIVYQNENEAKTGQNEFLYDFTAYSKGVYFINISSENKSKIIRIVIQ